MILSQPVRERSFACATASLLLKEKDRQGSHEREIASRGRFAHVAMVLSLGVIPPVMLLGFNRPVASHQGEQSLRIGLFRVQSGDSVTDLMSGLIHLALAEIIDFGLDAQNLGRSGQTEGGPVQRLAPELSFLNPPVAFVQRLSLRGGYRPKAPVWPWRRREADCL